jgi:photosystem II stability/assembly factor-like uncharacterized protein
MDCGLLRSADGGKSYESLFPAKGYSDDVNGHVWRVLVSEGKIIATSSPWGKDVDQVILSDDGKNFRIIRDGLPAKKPSQNTMWERGYARAIAADPKDPREIYLGIDGDDGGGLFISEDGGEHWKISKGQPASRRIYNALAVDPTDPKRIFWGAYGRNGGIYLSEDKGLTWKLVFSRVRRIFDIAAAQDGNIYAAGDAPGPAVYVSRDHGKNWSLLKKISGDGTAEALCPLPDGRLAFSTVFWNGKAGARIYLGKNDTWQDITGDLPYGDGASSMAFDPKNKILFMARYAGSVYKLKIE